MDRRRKHRYQILAGLQVLAAAAIAGAVFFLLYRYVQYGERFAREAGAVRWTGDPDAEETESENIGSGTSTARTDRAGKPEPESGSRGASAAKTDRSEETENSGSGTSAARTGRSEEAESESSGADALQSPNMIRVRLLTDDFAGEYHDTVEVTSDKSFTVKRDGKPVRKGKSYSVNMSELEEGQVLELICRDGSPLTVKSLSRADGHPRYSGTLWLYREPDGIALVNELPLEEYLCSVVASEMPSDYPEEAQKAQAVCARTYAYNCIRNARRGDLQGRITADLDDSVNFQVYNNYHATAQSRLAVEATRGEVLPLDDIQYYSTSCLSEHREDLDSDEAFRAFLSQEPDAGAEYDSPWLRWELELSAQDILQGLIADDCRPEDRIDGIRVTRRAGNGQVQELEISSGDSVKRVDGEYAVRQLLSPGQAVLWLRNGEAHSGMRLLPSAFFWLEIVGQREQQELNGAQGQDGQRESSRQQESDGAQGQNGQQESEEAQGQDGQRESSGQQGTDVQQKLDGQQKPGSEEDAEIGEDSEAPVERVVIHGGGYGHGVGMSQCGAAAMAEKGLDYREILEYYYQCKVTG